MSENKPAFLSYPGEMARLMREKDWSQTSLGPPEQWPPSLQTVLGIILHSRFPMFVWWGPELLCFYNDAYRPSLGSDGKHPAILGQPAAEAWPEIWHIIHPLIRQVLDDGVAVWSEDQLVPIYRNGKIEDVYWTFSYSRICTNDGLPCGVLVTCVETTDKVNNRRQLEESKNLLEFATEAAELGTWEYNPQTGKFIANARLKSWFGLQPEEETDLQDAIALIVEKDRPRVLQSIEAALDYSRQQPYDIEYRLAARTTGEERVVLVKGRPFFDHDGIAYRFSGTMEDITEKHRVRQALSESEMNLRNLVEQAPVAMCVMKGPQHVVEIINERMIQLWGKTKGEVIHRPVFEGLPEAANQGLEELLDNVYKTGDRFTASERPVQLPRGNRMETVFQNFVYEPLLGIGGVIEGVIAVTIDVTEQVIARRKLEEAEERARLATEAAQLGTFDYDIETNAVILSPRFHEIFDTEPGSPHDVLVSRIHPDDRALRTRAHEEARQSGRLFYEARLTRGDGRINWIRVEGSVLKNKEGNHSRIVGTVLDFTEMKDLEQKREEYFAIASHELRNPLTSLKLTIDLLVRMVQDREQQVLLQKSQDQVSRLIAMTGELLNVSRISTGNMDLKPEVINLRQCIEESIITAQAGAGLNSFEITGTSDINIRADKFRIEQVLVNLLTNASKYSPRGSAIRIDVSTCGAFMKVKVIDRGIGIDEGKTNAIFKKFSRIEVDKSIDGYGLGLYISDQIVRTHGGKMGVESEKGVGSVFWFTLPR